MLVMVGGELPRSMVWNRSEGKTWGRASANLACTCSRRNFCQFGREKRGSYVEKRGRNEIERKGGGKGGELKAGRRALGTQPQCQPRPHAPGPGRPAALVTTIRVHGARGWGLQHQQRQCQPTPPRPLCSSSPSLPAKPARPCLCPRGRTSTISDIWGHSCTSPSCSHGASGVGSARRPSSPAKTSPPPAVSSAG